jgi:predicted lactoylglutathione lyase
MRSLVPEKREHREPVGREVGTMTKLDHLGVQVADRNRARDWYVETLGLSESSNVVPECTLYFQVDDVDRLHRSLADRGVAFVYAPQQNPWGYGAELLDPDGHTVRLWDEVSMKRHAQSQTPP